MKRSTRLRRLDPDLQGPIVLDTDAANEIDDQFAIVYALLSDLPLQAIYAAPFHNTRSDGPADGMKQSYAEINTVLDQLEHSAVPSFEGSDVFLSGTDEPVASPAVEDLITRARSSEDPLHVVVIGTPTNVASAILSAPDIIENIVVIWVGGHPHSWVTAADFNLKQDPDATRVLFDSGVPLIQIPAKNVSEHLVTTLPELRQYVRGCGSIGTYLYDLVVKYQRRIDGCDGSIGWGKELWDVATIAYLIEPKWVPTSVVHTPELTTDLTWNHNPDRHFMRVATDVHRNAIFRDLFELLQTNAAAGNR